MEIAVASGKGGTGKTTISLSLAAFCRESGYDVALLDCDVEEPNANLFLGAAITGTEKCEVPVPSVDDAACTGCGRCGDICQYSAIVLIKGRPLVLPEMCHSCGGCMLVCPERAISERNREIGVVEKGEAQGIRFAGGRLDIGEPMSPPLIRDVKMNYGGADIRIIDSPPGTSCPVIESVKNADFLLLVAEPTPFGLNDLRLAAGMAEALGIPAGIVINKGGEGDSMIAGFCGESGIPLLGSIPDSRIAAENYSRGDCVSFIMNYCRAEIEKISSHIFSNSRRRVSL